MSDWFLYPNKPIRVASIETFFSACRGRESDWVLQSKHDGDRCIITVDREDMISIFSRHGNLLVDSAKWGHISRLPLKKPFTLDGEYVRENLIVVWDYGYESGELVGALPYEARLDKVLSLPNLTTLEGYTVRPVKSLPVHPRNLDKLLAGERVEGVVAKRKNARDLWGVSATREVPSQVKWRR